MIEDRDAERFHTVRSAVMAFVAHWSMAEAVPVLNVVHTAQGLMMVSEESRNGGQVMTPPSEEQLQGLATRHRNMAERYIGQAVTYCKQHLDLFPEIAAVGTDTEHDKSEAMRDNRGKKTFLA